MNKQNYLQNKKEKNQPSIKKAIFKQKQELKKLDYLKKYPYTVVRWPEDRNGLLFGIVQSAFISNKIREVGEVIGTCTVCSGFKRIPNVKFHFKGTREECLERFSVLSYCYRQYFNDSGKTTRPDCILTE